MKIEGNKIIIDICLVDNCKCFELHYWEKAEDYVKRMKQQGVFK